MHMRVEQQRYGGPFLLRLLAHSAYLLAPVSRGLREACKRGLACAHSANLLVQHALGHAVCTAARTALPMLRSACVQEVETHVARLGQGLPTPPAATGATPSAGPSAVAGTAGEASTSAAAAAPAPAAAAGPSKSAAEGLALGAGKRGEVELGGDRRCTVSEFRGNKLVDLREWYRKVGRECV